MSLIGCPWGYEEQELDHMRTCIPNRAVLGLGEVAYSSPPMLGYPVGQTPTPPIFEMPIGFRPFERPPSVPIEIWDPIGTQQAKVAQAGFAAMVNPPAPAGDYTWLMYAGLAVVGLLVLTSMTKGRR